MTSATDDILITACEQVGLKCADASLLRAHSASVYLLPHEHAVVRISHAEHQGMRAAASVAIAAWLVGQNFPATEPLIDHAIEVDTAVVTFWRYYPQEGLTKPPAKELGRILRRLHLLPSPPFGLRPYPPLAGLQRALFQPNVLTDDDRVWLHDRAIDLTQQYHRLDSVLGVDFVHGDAYPGNTLWGPNGALLGDWDEASIAPRELDLVNTYQGVRYGVSEVILDEFTAACGWDVREWEGFSVLKGMRDLHTLTSFIRKSRDNQDAAAELQLRVETLRNPNDRRLWHSVS